MIPRPITTLEELERLQLAEEVVWGLIVLMHLGGLDIPQAERDFLKPELNRWVDLAVETGIMQEDDGSL